MGKFVGILDYGAGNLFSVIKALDAAGLSFKVVESDDDIDQAVFLLLPGVGSFDQVMDMIRSYPFYDKFMHSVIVENKPIVGICIGMQILCESSAEGGSDGLGLIEDSQVVYFETSPFKTNLGPSQVSSNTFISDEKKTFPGPTKKSFFLPRPPTKNEQRKRKRFQKGHFLPCQRTINLVFPRK